MISALFWYLGKQGGEEIISHLLESRKRQGVGVLLIFFLSFYLFFLLDVQNPSFFFSSCAKNEHDSDLV